MYPSTGGFGGGGFTHPGQQPQGERGIERRFIFQGRAFLEGKIQKNGKNFFKIFIVQTFVRSYRSFIYL